MSKNELQISDIEDKIYERMQELEEKGDFQSQVKLNELSKLHGWILNDEPY